MQIIKKLFCSHFSVNKGLIQHVVQSCYNYNITFRKLEIHTVKMRPISACYTSGRGARHFLGIGRCTISALFKMESPVFTAKSFPQYLALIASQVALWKHKLRYWACMRGACIASPLYCAIINRATEHACGTCIASQNAFLSMSYRCGLF